jgi:hypothetical protein
MTLALVALLIPGVLSFAILAALGRWVYRGRRRARAWRLDHAHELPGGDRRPLGVDMLTEKQWR